jgi:hypothetical protein
MYPVEESPAYDNGFFRLAADLRSRVRLTPFVREWFPVTYTYSSSLLRYVSRLVESVRASPVADRARLDRALLIPLRLATEEFGSGASGIEAIHYRMFARLGEPLQIEIEDLLAHPHGQINATRELCQGIEQEFDEIYSGAGCIRVVECTAYNICIAMRNLFCRDSLKESFRSNHLQYIRLHLGTELGHGRLSEEFAELLCSSEEANKRVNEASKRIGELFGQYWERLAEEVFDV